MHYRATGLQATLKTQGRKARWLAEKVGVHESLLSKAMKGQRTINAETAAKIADLLGVPFFVLWRSPDGDNMTPEAIGEEEAA